MILPCGSIFWWAASNERNVTDAWNCPGKCMRWLPIFYVTTRGTGLCTSKIQAYRRRSESGNWWLGSWSKGNKEAVEWCQDQWRRKEPILPYNQILYTVHELATVPWFDNIPLCHRCGVPCPSCREELASDLPLEISTAQAIVYFDAIHEDQDLLIDLDNDDDDGLTSSKEEELPLHASPIQLRWRKRK